MKITKAQSKKLRSQHVGTGWITLKISEDTIMEIEICVGKDGIMRRIANGKPLLPIDDFQDDDGAFSCASANEPPSQGTAIGLPEITWTGTPSLES